ncbi:MAG: GntR family transcriptional regulator [Hyphomicrobiaceae bacterium]
MGRTRNGRSAGEIVQELRERISSHALPPGSKLQEADLVTEFGVSRSCIREVLSALEQRRLIRREPNRGAVVIRLAVDRVYELYELREMLEGLCARLAAEKAPSNSWDDLYELFQGPMAQCVETTNVFEYIRGLEVMRSRMIEAAHNDLLRESLDSIRDQTLVIIRRMTVLPGRMAIGLLEHRAVIDALRAGDPNEAERTARANIRSAVEYIRRFEAFVL